MLDGAFTRGTTPTHVFPVPDYARMSDIEELTITYRQKCGTILTKTKEDLVELAGLDLDTNIAVVLTQEETLLFDPRFGLVEVQIKAKSRSNDVFTWGNYRLRLDDVFDTEIL